MLSRVADNLYWMSRYLERAEHTAHQISIHLDLMLDQSPESVVPRRQRLIAALQLEPDETPTDDYDLITGLSFNRKDPTSLLSHIAAARENARQVREQISEPMWNQINQLYLFARDASVEEIWQSQPDEFFEEIERRTNLFYGVTDSTMNHGEGWHFIQLGRFLERASTVAALVDAYFESLPASMDNDMGSDDYLDWVALLKSCTAFEAYCKVYTADLSPQRIANFLILNAEFPHSISFSIEMVQNALAGIGEATDTRKAGRVYRLVGRLRAALDYDQIDEIMQDGIQEYLRDIQRQCAQIHKSLYQLYITYPIESALPAWDQQRSMAAQ